MPHVKTTAVTINDFINDSIKDVDVRKTFKEQVAYSEHLISLNKGEEYIVRASSEGQTYSLSILNNGLAWIVGSNESHCIKSVDSDFTAAIFVPNGEDTALVLITGMAEFTVVDYTGIYHYHKFVLESVDGVAEDLMESDESDGPARYRYWSKPDELSLSLSIEISRLKELAMFNFIMVLPEIKSLPLPVIDPAFGVGKTIHFGKPALVVRIDNTTSQFLEFKGSVTRWTRTAFTFNQALSTLVDKFPAIAAYKEHIDGIYRQ